MNNKKKKMQLFKLQCQLCLDDWYSLHEFLLLGYKSNVGQLIGLSWHILAGLAY